tara:strand:+ start:1315 stop:1986 length:672 start_codon:yes stop_codon:yes gene_type:complete
MKTICMIPARMGSQRLKKKNLRIINNTTLIAFAIKRCHKANVFDEIWVNSEHTDFAPIAEEEQAHFHLRPEELGSNSTTSEQYIYEFLSQHTCDWLFQVHSIAPLLTPKNISKFVKYSITSNHDTILSYIPEQIECALNGHPINFDFQNKINSQELEPIQRITWSITAWRADCYMKAFEAEKCATYSGNVSLFPVDRISGHVIKTEEDLQYATSLLPLIKSEL